MIAITCRPRWSNSSRQGKAPLRLPPSSEPCFQARRKNPCLLASAFAHAILCVAKRPHGACSLKNPCCTRLATLIPTWALVLQARGRAQKKRMSWFASSWLETKYTGQRASVYATTPIISALCRSFTGPTYMAWGACIFCISTVFHCGLLF